MGPAGAATAATQVRLCCFQCFFWHGRSQYQARWHCEQHILAPSDWQWKQRWVSSGTAPPFPFLPVVPLVLVFGGIAKLTPCPRPAMPAEDWLGLE